MRVTGIDKIVLEGLQGHLDSRLWLNQDNDFTKGKTKSRPYSQVKYVKKAEVVIHPAITNTQGKAIGQLISFHSL